MFLSEPTVPDRSVLVPEVPAGPADAQAVPFPEALADLADVQHVPIPERSVVHYDANPAGLQSPSSFPEAPVPEVVLQSSLSSEMFCSHPILQRWWSCSPSLQRWCFSHPSLQ